MKSLVLFIVTLFITFLSTIPAQADYTQRFSFGVGFVHSDNPSSTDFELGAEFEYRVDPMLGLGLQGNSIFSNPAIGLVGAPEIFFHPFSTEWFLSASPIIEFGSGVGTHVGERFGTRLPISLGALTLIPTFAVDLIAGRRNYWFGIGIQL